ncbi:hypothetical protein ERIC2_c10320 [Paenibacillus larvae subsp. larvae DSM 25430]|uniref:Uncharacterized protein n=1 Tax=Paenibacillus larvae subsp. larvae DSM 25430 TaxID=697284 RepID=V9W4K4_9BACL|nr:hypothetical protein ERIC2_c10320 [Paenibacillus larvae subsp. larvae DSM 25430]
MLQTNSPLSLMVKTLPLLRQVLSRNATLRYRAEWTWAKHAPCQLGWYHGKHRPLVPS